MNGLACIGQITNWGSRGFGFIKSPELDVDAWTHVNLVVSGYEPKIGDRVSFIAYRSQDGRVQARGVRPVPAEPPSPAPPTVEERGRGQQPALPPSSEAATGHQRLGAQLDALRPRIEAEQARLHADADRYDARLRELTAQVDRAREEALAASGRLQRFPSEAVAQEWSATRQYLAEQREALNRALEIRARDTAERDEARLEAIAAVGEASVLEYEDLRRRAAGNGGGIETTVYKEAAERRGQAVPRYAVALNTSQSREACEVPLLVFLPDATGSDGLVVLPLGAAAVAADGLGLHLALAFMHLLEINPDRTGEAAQRDPLCLVEGCIAARVRIPERELLEVMVLEALGARPLLGRAGLSLRVETVSGVCARASDWLPSPSRVDVPRAADPQLVPYVATRLNLSVEDLVGVLVGNGLPFPDDRVDDGVEQTLRQLLRVEVPQAEEPEAAAVASATGAPEPISPRSAAARLLAKMLRDRRVGGRHTQIDNVSGHHFGDDEKSVARVVVERLVRAGILLPKMNGGSHHVSINPRRLADVGKIIEGRFDDDELFRE